MNSQPTFSVIIPVSKQPVYLAQALDSVLAQSDPDWEAIIIYDDIDSATLALLRSYADRDLRIKMIGGDHRGIPSALNEGLRHAQGTWLCWLHPDDQFDPRKLEIHRRHIHQEPQTAYFHTDFFLLREEDNQVATPPLRATSFGREWQLLEMLRVGYLESSSVCVKRDAVEQTGGFDERLLYGYDYDLWLRLLLRYPATLIVERTCIRRAKRAQSMELFTEEHLGDSCRAAINLLNRHIFEELIPFVDLSDAAAAKSALEKALDVAASFDSPFLYGLGPHAALLWRILEWVFGLAQKDSSAEMRQLVESKVGNVLKRKELDPAIRLQWKLAYAVNRLPRWNFAYASQSAEEIAQKRNWQAQAMGKSDLDEVVIACQIGTQVNYPIKYGAARAWMELAHYLQRNGKQVLLIGVAGNRAGLTEGVPYLGVQSEDEITHALQLFSPLDALIGISRADIFLAPSIKHPLIYQHGPHLPMGEFATTLIRRRRLPVVVVSRDSMQYQIQQGVPKEQLHVAHNGYNATVFKPNAQFSHLAQRIVFAGMGVYTKGLDIAVQAFALLKNDFPDAQFYIYGENRVWDNTLAHLWPAHWLDAKGYPLWTTIEQEVPGIRYCGEVTPAQLAEAFQTSSLLLVPSRLSETFGLVSIEAQACGCIPILPRRGGFPETLQEGVTGYLYDNNTPEDVAQLIRQLWDKELPTEEQRVEAARWVKQEFSWTKTGEQIVKLLESLDARQHRLLASERLFWQEATRWKVRARTAYHQSKSPILRKMRAMLSVSIDKVRGKPNGG